MRLLFVLIFLLAPPVLVIAHRQHYSTGLQGPLFVQVGMALDAPEFAQVDATLNYMDVTLKGRVADLASRERARKQVNDIRGLRCREQDNLIQVTTRLTGRLTGSTLAVSGWLHDEAALRDVTQWLTVARPGIRIETDGVKVSPHVTVEDPPAPGSVPAPYRALWSAIEVPPSLKVVREGAKLTLSGSLPSAALKEAVITALLAADAKADLNTVLLATGAYVRAAKFADDRALPLFLKAFFSTPGAVRFEVDGRTARLTGHATPTMQREWLALLAPLADTEPQAQVELFASVHHFPGRTRESKGPADALAVLQDVLRAAVVNFGPGYATADAAEQPKLLAAAAAITAAGPEVRIVVGGHVDLTGNAKDNETMARRRAESVVADLVGKGVPPQVLETAVFEPVPGTADRSRQVEFVIK